MRYIKRIEKTPYGLIINEKYFISKNGVIYYSDNYIGTRKRDFPQYLFRCKKLLLKAFYENN